MSLALFLATFAVIFIAAAPGRTTFVLILLASQARPITIFWGAAAAFLIQSLISVLLGQLLTWLPQYVVELLAGVLFIYFARTFWKQSRAEVALESSGRKITGWSSFVIIFMAEFGDVSQLTIAATAARSPSIVTVFVAAVVALWLLTGCALFFGNLLKRVADPRNIQKAASGLFLLVGLFLIVRGANVVRLLYFTRAP